MRFNHIAYGLLGLAAASLTIAACAAQSSDDGTTAGSTPAAPQRLGTQVLTGHISDAIMRAPVVGRIPASNRMTVSIGLAARDPKALADAVAQVSDPASASYRQYVTPEQFGERFGVAAADYQAVADWAQANNLTVEAHPNRLITHVTGEVKDLEAALHLHFQYALRADGTQFHKVDAEPSLDLRVPVQHISNLENFELPKHASGGSGPNGSRQGNDFRNAYASGSALTGAGQTIGIFMFDGFSQADLAAYAHASGLPTPPTVSVVQGDGQSASGVGVEGSLDVQMAFSMAPGAQITVFTGSATTILSNMTKQPGIKQLSSSWFWPNSAAAFQQQVQLQQELALQGQSFFQATGDNGSYTSQNGPNGTDERESPYLTLVGGTEITLSGSSWISETAWGDSSGGILSNGNMPIPFYQVGLATSANQASSVYRNAPDVSAEASDVNIIVNANPTQVGGTSAATPLWAGFMALVNQEASSYGMGSVGFANPALYAVAASTKYASTFHDITSGSCPCDVSTSACLLNGVAADYSAASGFDLCTGLGSPKTALIDAIANVHASKATPAIAALNGVLHATYIAHDSSNTLLHISSSDGTNWTSESVVAGHASSAGPALAAFNGQLHMTYIANNTSNQLLHISSADGVHWGTETVIAGRASKTAPSLAVFGNKLYMAYIANNSSNDLLVDSSFDGVNWGSEAVIGGHASSAAPSLAVFNGRLFMSYVANNSSGTLLMVSTGDGVNWTQEYIAQAGRAAKSTPSLAVYGNSLYIVYLANNARNDIMTLGSTDGVHFGSEHPIGHQSAAAPSAIGFNGALRLAYIANNANELLLRVSTPDGLSWGPETVW